MYDLGLFDYAVDNTIKEKDERKFYKCFKYILEEM